MKTKNIISIVVGALALVSCQDATELPQQGDSNEITINVQHPSAKQQSSQAMTRATSTHFEVGDTIGLFAVEYIDGEQSPLQVGGNYLNNEPIIYNGTEWEGKRNIYWSSEVCDFYGFYPYIQIDRIKDFLFDVSLHQDSVLPSGMSGYETSDLLYAYAEGVERVEDGEVELQFSHVLSNLVVVIERGEKFEGDLPTNINVDIINTVTKADVDLEIGSATKYPYGEKNRLRAMQTNDSTFSAIVVPQFIERQTPLIEVNMDGIAYLLEYSISFKPGMQHKLYLILNTSPDQEKLEISIDGTINDWN